MDNTTLAYLMIICIVMCFVAIGLFISDIIIIFRINKKLEKFDKWCAKQEKHEENEKLKVIKKFEEWYLKENKDE